MNSEQLDRIEKMLRAQLKSAGHVWWIGGYVYGVTSNDDLFVILYPADEKLNEKVVRVYPHDFKKLPGYIQTEGIDGGDTEANPNKEAARKKGIYHECPPFEIVTVDGKETQMGRERRFGDVLRISQAGRAWHPQARQSPPAPPQPPPTATQRPLVTDGLPDFRAMAIAAKTATEFDYAAFMVLQNGLYTEVGHITKTREVLIQAWRPTEKSNKAMLAALETYRDERQAAEGRGVITGEAHKIAKKLAVGAYNETIG